MINFIPERRQVLIADYDMAGVPPEMRKKRRVVVVSPRSYNLGGRCVVVPFSASPPRDLAAAHVPFKAGVYSTLSVDVWAICDAVSHVSHARLDRVSIRKSFAREYLSEEDMARIEEGLRHALGMLRK